MREYFFNVLFIIEKAHRNARSSFTPSLPEQTPQDEEEIEYQLDVNRRHTPPNTTRFCELITNKGKRLVRTTTTKDNVSWYYDPLPTNCVSTGGCPV